MKMKKSSNFKYFVSEGCKSYTSNGLMSLASTIIVVASLVVLGLYLLFSMNIACSARIFCDEVTIVLHGAKPHSTLSLYYNLLLWKNQLHAAFVCGCKSDTFTHCVIKHSFLCKVILFIAHTMAYRKQKERDYGFL